MAEQRGRIPSLDGLRAVSIVLVVWGHLQATQGSPLPALHPMTAAMGVRVFFVISGFLITTLLLREWQRRGAVSLRAVYLRAPCASSRRSTSSWW